MANPFTSPEEQILKQRQRMADLLRASALQGDNQTQMAGGWAIQNNQIAPFKRLGMALIANRAQRGVDEDAAAYSKNRAQMLADALTSGDPKAVMQIPGFEEVGANMMRDNSKQRFEAEQSAIRRRADEDEARRDREAEMLRAETAAKARTEAARIAAEARLGAAEFTGGEANLPATIQEWNMFQAMTPEQKSEYIRMKRATNPVDAGGSFVFPNPADPTAPPVASIPKTLRPGESPEEQAAVAAAKLEAESEAKKRISVSGIQDVTQMARDILTGKAGETPTASGVGSAVDGVAGFFGFAPDGAAQADKLRAIAGQLVAKMPRMEGPQSNFDVQNYKEMAGDVGNASLPIERRLAALEAVEQIYSKYAGKGASAPSAPPSADGWQTLPNGVRVRVKSGQQ